VPWDRERYRLEVLEPARQAGNVPPLDLYVRYGLPSDISDPAAFGQQVHEVLDYWRELRSSRVYARLADALIARHAELAPDGPLTLEKFTQRHAQAHREQTDQLARLADAEAGAATHVGPATLARLRSALGRSVTDAEVTEALQRAGVRVVAAFPQLPAAPHPKQADLAQHVRQLSKRLSAEVVFGDAVRHGFRVLGGFRLADSRRLDEAALDEARRQTDALPYSAPGKATTENVLAILRGAARTPGDLDALLLSEVVEWLRQFAGRGFVQRAIAGQARELGLEEDEAGLIAAAMFAGGALEPARQQVEEELTAGRLRTAQRLAAGLPAGDPLRERVAALDAQVTALIRRADQELAQGRRELAATRLAEAARIAADDASLAERLAALPPPPPRNAAARVDGDHVLVTWGPSPALAGRVRYRVRRGQDRAPVSPAEGTAVAAQTGRNDVTDTEPPLGADLIYSVFADRGGEACSPPAVTQSVVFAPDVTGISVTAADTSVAVSWRAHAADAVLVVRGEGRPPRGTDDGTAVEASLAGFTDAGLRTGTEYFYRIAASYRAPGGQRRQSAGIVVPVVPEPQPEAVTDLDVAVLDDGMPLVAASWTPPPHGQVRLAMSDEPPPWPAGARITQEDVAGLSEISALPRRGGDGRDSLQLRLPSGRHHLVALTWGASAIVVGAAAEVSLVGPVSALSAARMHDAVQLAWVWPPDATDAVIRWPGGERRCSRRVYDDEGGVTITVGPAETSIEVRAVYPHPGERLTAPAALVRVPGRGVAVSYRIRRPGPLRPRQRIVELTSERPTKLPPLVLVRTTGPYAPDDPAGGETVGWIEPQPIAPGQPVAVTVELPRGRAWLACFVDPGAPIADARAILLFPPPAGEMRIR
jgi:hypothetical protein